MPNLVYTFLRALRSVCLTCVLAGALLAQATPVRAERGTDAICDQAASRASRATGVPVAVLRAITRTETGRSRDGALRPWPWTVNMEGTGKWFDERSAAHAYANSHFDRGARSFDVGCFQLNYRWHGDGFSSIENMFDPDANALYAARFLKSLYAEFGDWSSAAGAYHSRTPKYATRYKERFNRIYARLSGSQLPPAPAPARPGLTAVGSGPLVVAQGTAGPGSLVPSGAAVSR